MTDNEMNRFKITLYALKGVSCVILSDTELLSKHVFDSYRSWLVSNPFFYDVVDSAEFRCSNGNRSVSFPAYGSEIQFLTYGNVPRCSKIPSDTDCYMWAAIDDV